MKTFVIGDIHGAYKALLQCFERAKFKPEHDRLISLGDICDGYPEVSQCVDELLKIKYFDLLKGNHDIWALNWALKGELHVIWTSQGGENTVLSYKGGPVPAAHIDFLKCAKPWLELDGRLFVHGGFDPDIPLALQTVDKFAWDRDLLDSAWLSAEAGQKRIFGPYTDIFVGHTPTQVYYSHQPLHVCNIWDLDTGAGWTGRLTIMDVESKQYWQSDPTPQLYPGVRPRRRG
jgi:serine/threonine protein phosphatase 1